MEERTRLISWLNDENNIPYCGDSSCQFATPNMKRGMHTNGRCRCLQGRPDFKTRHYINNLIRLRDV